MDANYLKQNVFSALSEALTAMSVRIPEDRIEFIGHYLLQYVERKNVLEDKTNNLQKIEKSYEESQIRLEKQQHESNNQLQEQLNQINKLPAFCDVLQSTANNKFDVADKVTNFINEYIDVSCYVANKQIIGENEYLYYIAANNGQDFMRGKKLLKVVADDENVTRQGLSFDAFIIPEVPESEEGNGEEENDEESESKPKPPPPTAQPIVIDNVMRDKRIKFFGIPKLGSYVAVPFAYQSIDHEAGFVPYTTEEYQQIMESDMSAYNAALATYQEAKAAREAREAQEATENEDPDAPKEEKQPEPELIEPEQPKARSLYKETPVTKEFIVAFDSIGKYRRFKQAEIDQVKTIGEAVVKSYLSIESKMMTDQTTFYESQKKVTEKIESGIAKLQEDEAQVLIPTAEETAPPVEQPPPSETSENPEEPVETKPVPESLKISQDAIKVLAYWTKAISLNPYNPAIEGLLGHVCPLPTPAMNLFLTIFYICGHDIEQFKDNFGEIQWELMRTKSIAKLPVTLMLFDPNERKIKKEQSMNFIKSFMESTSLAEGGSSLLPPYIPVLKILFIWLQKAIAAKEAVITYHRDITDGGEHEIIE